jgi:DNA (cytosine-5)-methyltransferase 1
MPELMSRSLQPVDQTTLPFPPPLARSDLSAVDLFAGTGGLSLGFASQGFSVTGIDSDRASGGVFAANAIGAHRLTDLHAACFRETAPIVIGGPPCRPWSAVNMQRRGSDHGDHVLVVRFFEHLLGLRPLAFLMENVPPLAGDPLYHQMVAMMRRRGYSVEASVLRYADFGAATTRKRLFTIGFSRATELPASDFFERLAACHRPAATVRDAIAWLAGTGRGEFPDHEWSAVTTIGKYRERYETGRFGWRRLAWDETAPSFGTVSKTYILHPDSDAGSGSARVLSVREVLCLMGFSREFRFPDGLGISIRYRMAANAVSPLVSAACAGVLRSMLTGENGPAAPTAARAHRTSGLPSPTDPSPSTAG